jgi:hypothetical protein
MVEPIVIPDATREPHAYVEALLQTLGERDPSDVYEATPGIVSGLCQALGEEHWRAAPAPGEWNAFQIVGHLADGDIVYGFRWRLALTEDDPSYPGYNEKAWSELARPSSGALLAGFAALRGLNVALIRSITGAEWDRTAVHAEQGRENVKRMVQKIAGHDLAHLNQLQRTIEATRSDRSVA